MFSMIKKKTCVHYRIYVNGWRRRRRRFVAAVFRTGRLIGRRAGALLVALHHRFGLGAHFFVTRKQFLEKKDHKTKRKK